MNGSATTRVLSRLWLLIIGVVAVAVLYLAKIVFVPFAFAILFAFLLAPLVARLERLHFPRSLAAAAAILLSVGLIGAAAWGFFNQLVDIANDLPIYRDNITQKIQAVHIPSNSDFARAQHELEHLSEEIGLANTTAAPPVLNPGANPAKKSLGASPDHPLAVREVNHRTGRLDQLGGVLGPLATAVLSVVFTFFVILQREDLRNRLIRLSGDRNLSVITKAMDDASNRVSRYFRLQLSVNLIYAGIICVVLRLIDLPHPLLFGAIAGLFRFVPYIGWPMAAAMPTFLSMAVFHGWEKSLLIVFTFIVLEIVTANYIEPRIYGRHTGLSSLAIVVAASFWTLLWGPVGLALSIPLTVCLVVIGRHVPALEFLTVMLGDRPAMPAWTCFYQRLLARDEREAAEILDTCVKDRPIEEVFDAVLIPALALSEEDRLERDLDESTVRFIRRTSRELIEELSFRDNGESHSGQPAARIMCVPVRDDTDELAAMMLAQALNHGPLKAIAAPVRGIDEAVDSIAAEAPDLVFLSGMPPFGLARAHRLYRGLRSRSAGLRIMIAIWSHQGDIAEAARRISGGEEVRIFTHLSEAVAEVRSLFIPGESAPSAEPESEEPISGYNAA
ncbi:MAG TPA: AI-2E family transporter [Terracidiphilus sp.]|nr:AI-2E family transporter [Terracidiphilus sp.]